MGFKFTAIALIMIEFAWFDLNYVGFKLRKCDCIEFLGYSLIWTMWDLNMKKFIAEIRAFHSLIWTMWDLNPSGKEKGVCVLCGFDLNYVGFKLSLRLLFHIRKKRLIWTMWDLNIAEKVELDDLIEVWSELCGI